jgi:pseudouridine kinase
MLTDYQSVCCIGGITLDRTLLLHDAAILGTSNPATSHQSCGGVARNVAENLARLSVRCQLIGVVGDDEAGTEVIRESAGQGIDTSLVATRKDGTTGSYSAVMQPDGELLIGVADMDIFDTIDRQLIDSNWEQIASAVLVFADTNMPADSFEHLVEQCRDIDKRLFVDAVSVPKAPKLPAELSGIEMLFCNLAEARAILGDGVDPDDGEAAVKALAVKGAATTVVTAGADGLWCADRRGCKFLPAVSTDVVDVSGAGDALIAGTLFGRLMGRDPVTSCKIGLQAASMTISSIGRHSANLSADRIMDGVDPVEK